jgi:hypothetical protein
MVGKDGDEAPELAVPGRKCLENIAGNIYVWNDSVHKTKLITDNNQIVRKIKVTVFLWHISRITDIKQI